MSDFLLYASVVALFLVCILVVLVILMQRPSANAGMGSALGGGAAETVFGGESANVLSKMTTTLTVILFILDAKATAPVTAPATAAPAATAPAAAAPVAAPAAAKPQSTPAPAASTPAKPAAPAPAK
jgi:preprotein translocase subunit SecG